MVKWKFVRTTLPVHCPSAKSEELHVPLVERHRGRLCSAALSLITAATRTPAQH